MTTHQVQGAFEFSRVGQREGSCALLTAELDVEFLVTDDLRALPELQTVADPRVAIPPIALKALVGRDVLERRAAVEKLDELAERRDRLGARSPGEPETCSIAVRLRVRGSNPDQRGRISEAQPVAVDDSGGSIQHADNYRLVAG